MNNFKIHMHVLNLRTGWYGESSSNLFFVNLLIRAVLPTQYFPTTMTFFSAFDPILKTNKTGLLTSIQLLTITRYCIMHITINSIHANGSFEVRQVKSHSF